MNQLNQLIADNLILVVLGVVDLFFIIKKKKQNTPPTSAPDEDFTPDLQHSHNGYRFNRFKKLFINQMGRNTIKNGVLSF